LQPDILEDSQAASLTYERKYEPAWRHTMKNPGMDLEIWNELRRKWSELEAKGHKVKIDFQMIADPKDARKILAIEVVQHIDGKPVTETVQRLAGEGYAPLGIARLSAERLIEIYKELMKQVHSQASVKNIDVIVSMVPTSSTSGEIRGHLEVPDAPVQSHVPLNYQHYYVLNALRERMIERDGRGWKRVTVVYHAGELEFDFEYSDSGTS